MVTYGILTSNTNSTLSNDSPILPTFSDLSRRKYAQRNKKELRTLRYVE